MQTEKVNDSNPLVSVIIPVYNVELYLRECLDSVVNQTYTNLEILLVNDGSTDGSGSICREYAARDQRIRVFDKPNGGLSSARNVALLHAQGDYISFVDSDDWIALQTIEDCVRLAEEEQSDCVEFAFTMVYEDGAYTSINTRNTARTASEALEQALLGNVSLAACGWLYRRELLQGISFPEGRYHEDVVFTAEALLRIKSYRYMPKAYYYYRRGRSGAITEGFSTKRLDAFLNIDDLIKKYPEHTAYLNSLALFLMKHLYFDFFPTPARKEAYRILAPWIENLQGRTFFPASPKKRLLDKLFLYCPNLVAKLIYLRK